MCSKLTETWLQGGVTLQPRANSRTKRWMGTKVQGRGCTENAGKHQEDAGWIYAPHEPGKSQLETQAHATGKRWETFNTREDQSVTSPTAGIGTCWKGGACEKRQKYSPRSLTPVWITDTSNASPWLMPLCNAGMSSHSAERTKEEKNSESREWQKPLSLLHATLSHAGSTLAEMP